MNKKLIAAAVAGAFVAPAAFAQNSTVQIYGLLNVEYGYSIQPDAAAGGRSNVDALNSGASRIGFKGEEKLGGGLSAWWQCESDLRFLGGATQSSGNLCDRNSALGLKGGFGNVYIGTWDSPLKRVSGITRITNEAGWLGSQLMTLSNAGTGAGAWNGTFSTRNTNTVNYDTPNFNGFSASLQYTTLQVARNNTGTSSITNNTLPTAKGRQVSLSGQYVAGPMAIVAGYSKHDKDRTTVASAANYTQGLKDTAWLIGGTYQVGPVKLGLTYVDAEIETAVGASTERKSWAFAGDWSLGGPHSVKFGYNRAGDAKTNTGGGANTGAKLYQIGYNHALSKRTTASLSYARMDNKSAGTYMLTGHSGTPRAGENDSAFVLGLVHTF
jgi:predicted porin